MFLTPDELHDLTGYKQPARQFRWLERNGYKQQRAANGRPIVLRSHIEQRLSDVSSKPAVSLNFDALKRRA